MAANNNDMDPLEKAILELRDCMVGIAHDVDLLHPGTHVALHPGLIDARWLRFRDALFARLDKSPNAADAYVLCPCGNKRNPNSLLCQACIDKAMAIAVAGSGPLNCMGRDCACYSGWQQRALAAEAKLNQLRHVLGTP